MPLYVSKHEDNLIVRVTFDRPACEPPLQRRMNLAWLWKVVLG